MRARGLVLTHLLVLAAALAALTPLRVVLDMAGADALGLTADRIEGPFWAGRVVNARARGVPLGDLTVSVNLPVLMASRDPAARIAAVTVRDASGAAIPLEGLVPA